MSELQPKKPLIIFGLGDFSDIAYEYFTNDSDFEVVGFTVHAEYRNVENKFGLPVFAFEELTNHVSPKENFFFAAVLYAKMNDFRQEIALQAKKMGFDLATYVSSKSFVWRNVSIGEHCFIFENNTVQPYVSIGFNNVLWSGNHIGHHSAIGDNCFISSQVVISGGCRIAGSSFIGVNSTLSNNIEIGMRTWIGPGSLVVKDVPSGTLITSTPGKFRALDEQLLEERLQSIAVSSKRD
jgi:sugar O-acyltransferase (sialic acid O-acetyltransferase NeuD family)